MSSQAWEKSALKIDLRIFKLPEVGGTPLDFVTNYNLCDSFGYYGCFVPSGTMLLWLQLYLCAVMMKYEVCAVIV